MKKKNKKFLIIGLGRFGKSVAKELYKSDCEVVAIDIDESNLQAIDKYVHYSIVGDAENHSVLDDVEPETFDCVVVSIGEAVKSSILITKKLKDRNVKKIIAKALDQEQGEILAALGADEIVYPEEVAGIRVARHMINTNIIEYISINEDVSGIEAVVPEQFYKKSLIELDLSNKYGITVALIIRNSKPIISPLAQVLFQEGDFILIIGENKKIEAFKDKFLD